MSTGRGLNEFNEFAAAARSFRGHACVVIRPARAAFTPAAVPRPAR
jgi:hypothetical protein